MNIGEMIFIGHAAQQSARALCRWVDADPRPMVWKGAACWYSYNGKRILSHRTWRGALRSLR